MAGPWEEFSQTEGSGPWSEFSQPEAKKAEQGDYLRGLKKYVPQMQEMYGAGKALVGKAIDSEGMVQSGIETMQDANRKVEEIGSKPTDEFTNVKSVGDFADWAQHGLGQVTGNLAESLVAAGAGTLLGGVFGNPITAGVGGVGGLVGKQIIKKALKEQGEAIAENQAKKIIGKEVGQNTAIAGMAGFHGAGETGSRAFQEANYDPNQVDLGQVLPRAAGHAAAEFLGDKILLGGMLGKGAYRAAGEGAYPLVKTVAGNMAIVAGKEIPVEIFQTVMERDAAKLALMDQAARDEYINTAAQTMLFGVAGAPAGVRSYLSGKRETQPTTQLQATPEDTAQMDALNADLGGAVFNNETLVPSEQKMLPPGVITVPNQSGGTTEINRNDGALSAAVVDTGITGQISAGMPLRSYPDRVTAQEDLDRRQDADQMQIVKHPRTDGFAIVRKDRIVLEAQDQAAMRRQQLEEEDGNAPQLDEAGSQGRGTVAGGGGGNASAVSGIGGGRSNASASSVHGRGTSMAMGTADATESALGNADPEIVQARANNYYATANAILNDGGSREEAMSLFEKADTLQRQADALREQDPQVELAPAAAQPVSSMPGMQAVSKQRTQEAAQQAGVRAQQLAQEEDAVAEPTPQTVNVPRPMKVGGLRAAKYSDAQLQAVVDNESVPATSRRAAAAEIAWRQSEAESAAQAEIAQSIGKMSRQRAGESPADYQYRMAAEKNAAKAQRQQQPQTAMEAEDIAAVRRAIKDPKAEVSVVSEESMPDMDKATPRQVSKQSATFLRHVAKIFGKEIVFVDGMESDGFYQSGNKIYLSNKSSVHHVRVLGHEMLHALKRQSPETYKKLIEAVGAIATPAQLKAQFKDYFAMDAKMMDKTDAEIAEWLTDPANREMILEEMMADLSGNRWAESSFWESVFTKIDAKYGSEQAKGIIAKLRLALINALNKLMSLVKGGQFKVDTRVAEHLESIREALATGFADYAKAVKDKQLSEDGVGAVKFSGKQTNIDKLKKLMTDREKSKVGKRNADRIVELFNVMPSENEMAAVAYAGKAKRGWYKNSANALSHLFGAEARRFAGLLAALSPQVSVEVNTRNALRMWANWDAAGRPTDKPSIMRLLGQSVEGSGTESSVMGAWVNNSMDALTIKNLDDLTLSGPKVNSFMLNLVGNWEEVTNDAWVANYALVDQNLFSGTGKSKDGSDPGKGAGYLAMNVKTRMAAKILSKETGVTWTPAEVQETIWSWAKTMLETLDASGETRTAKQLMDDGVITDDLISATPDFELLFRQEPYAGILRNAGLGQKLNTMPMPKHEDPGRAPFADEKRQSMLDEAGRRIEFLQRQRRTNMQISWEAKPGGTTGILPGIFGAPLHVQQQYLADIFAEFDMLQVGKKLGIDFRRTLFGPSAWKGDVAAGAQTILQKIGIVADNMGSVKVDADSRKNLEVAASILGYVLNQEGVYWHYPIYRTPDNHAMYPTGVEVNFGRSLTTAEVAEFYGIVSKLAGHQDWAPANTPMGVRFLNFTSFNADPAQQFDHKQFDKIIERAAGKLKPWANGATMRSFTFDGDAIENNWKESPNGEDYKSRVGKAGRSDLLKWADDQLSPAIDRVNKRYADQYGWGPANRLERDAAETGATPDNFSAKFSPARGYERPAANGGVAGQGRPGDRQLGRVDVTGTHYSREQRKHLTGGYFGTGLAGEERNRLKEAKDTRLHSRLYAYVNEGQGVFPESGVGAYAHTVNLDNLYDIKADPLGIRQKTRDANDRESLIIDAGFDGYYAPQVFGRQGVAILMGGAATRGVTPTDTVAPAVNVETAPKTERRTDLPLGKMTGAEWKKLEPRATDLEDVKMYYRDDIKFSPARITVDGVDRPTENSNGKPIHPTEDGIRNFWRWFGDSKVVDADGKPLVVYHGRTNDFSVFNPNDIGLIFASPEKGFAEDYAMRGAGTEKEKFFDVIEEDGLAPNIIPVYLSLQNPWNYHNDGHVVELLKLLRKNGMSDGTYLKLENWSGGTDRIRASEIRNGDWAAIEYQQIVDAVKELGHDGIIMNELGFDNYAAFSTTQIKSAIGNNGQFDAANPDIRYSPPRWYFSPLEKAFESAPDKVFGQAAQVKLWLAGNKSKLGLKDDEIFWTGINDWLDMQGKQKVSKADVLGYLAGNGVQVEEVMKGDEVALISGRLEKMFYAQGRAEIDGYRIEQGNSGYLVAYRGDEKLGSARNLDRVSYLIDADRIANSGIMGDTKFNRSDLILPGGENYRELLLTLPAAQKPDITASQEEKDAWRTKADKEYRSGHWEEPNILAHIRMNDRVDSTGAKTLFIEEVQSDWGQEGKKKGFVSDGKLPAGWSVEEVKISPYATRWAVFDNSKTQVGTYAETKEGAIKSATTRNGFTGGTPPAPFVTDTKAWLGLSIKRIMAYAAANGYDKVAFINGEQSADRYDLSKQVDRIAIGNMPGGNYQVVARKNGDVVIDKVVEGERGLEAMVGKEIAERFLAKEKSVFEGLDLKIGGKGMVAFYDRIVPQVVSDQLKKVGGKMETVGLQTGGAAQVLLGEVNQHPGFTVTPKMSEPLPLFSPKRSGPDVFDKAERELLKKHKAGQLQQNEWIAGMTDATDRFINEVADRFGDREMALNIFSQMGIVPGNEYSFVNLRKHKLDWKTAIEAGPEVQNFKVMLDSFASSVSMDDAVKYIKGQPYPPQTVQIAKDFLVAVAETMRYAVNKKLASNQKPSGLLASFSPRRAQTETPEFKAWFGESKVVDADGNPLVVYRGGGKEYDDALVAKRFGAHFGTVGQANKVAGSGAYGDIRDEYDGRTPSVTPAYIRLENPWMYSGDVDNWNYIEDLKLAIANSFDDGTFPLTSEQWADGVQKHGTVESPFIKRRYVSSPEQVRKILEDYGVDGVIYDNNKEGVGKSYIVFNPTQVKSSIGNNGQFSPTDPDIRRSTARSAATGQPIIASWASPEISSFDNIVRQLQDKLIDTKRVVDTIRGAGKAISDVIDPYLQEILYHGRAAKKTQDFAEQELRPLLQSMQMRKVSMQEIEDFLWAQHAPERNAQNAKAGIQDGSGLTDGESRDILAGRAVTKNGRTIQLDAAKMPAYRELAKRFKAINDKTLDELVAYGLETRATVDQWKRTYQNYVPLMRDMSDDNYAGANNRGLGTGKGFSIRGSASKRAIGSQRGVIDIVANIAMQRERAITRGEKNKVSQATYGLALAAPNPDFWLPIDPAANRNPAAIAKLQQDLINLGMNPIDAQNVAQEPVQTYIDPNTGKASTRINPALRNRNDVLAVRINGEDKFLMFSSNDRAQAMVTNLKNLDDDQLGGFLQASAKITRWFASVNTQYNPVFGMVNGIRDFGGAMLNLTSTPLAGQQARVAKYGWDALRGIYSDLRDHRAGRKPSSAWAQEFEEFASNGGQTGYRDMFNTADDRTKALQKELERMASGDVKKWTSIGENHPVFAWLSDYNTAIENAFRLAAYKVAKENGMTQARAAQLAKNLTVNFNKKGLAATQTGALYAFFNAAVQGTARIGETLLQHNGNPSDYKNIRLSSMGKKIVLGGITLGVMQALLGAMAGWDDDEPKQFQRERNLIIPIPGSDKYISIPLPLGFHVLPNLGRITTEFMLSGFKNPGKRLTYLLGVMAEAFNPIGNAGMSLQTIAPTFADPLVALATNKDWNGQSIAREDFNRNKPTPGWSRTKDTASPWGKTLAYALNYVSGGGEYGKGMISPTPDQIDYLTGQVFGGVGREIIKLATSAKTVTSGEELPMYKVPIAGRFIGETTGVGPESGKYYSNLERIGAHKDPIKRMREDGKNKEVMAYYRENPEARLIVVADSTQRDISELKTIKRKLEKKGESQDRINVVNEQIKAKMRTFNNHVQKLEKKAD